MVIDVRFVKMKLLRRKLGVTATNIDPNIFVRFVSLKCGFEYKTHIKQLMGCNIQTISLMVNYEDS